MLMLMMLLLHLHLLLLHLDRLLLLLLHLLLLLLLLLHLLLLLLLLHLLLLQHPNIRLWSMRAMRLKPHSRTLSLRHLNLAMHDGLAHTRAEPQHSRWRPCPALLLSLRLSLNLSLCVYLGLLVCKCNLLRRLMRS